ncbi:hypothetical protein NDI56_14715 [Haloarcula sp. S1CR25-12]|uniref:Small CPxCG-related zinc finger protein n=1 Tax=Haloarcula saliterrae TaxID=2950534 RepID=A0ABU2FFS4_9EURY|nr:hypothetical protein [Haloarcula sp. S1CR25-12]MDS0260656.1 hypothetical protein [Haloarcula sp. S1CR25-12]
MFGSRRDGETVTCIACGEERPRSDAREYDKHGDRWDRRDKTFEFLCKGCFTETCRQPRDGLEATLAAADAGETDRATFLRQFRELVRERSVERE